METSYIYSRAAYLGLVGRVWVERGFGFAGRLGGIKLDGCRVGRSRCGALYFRMRDQ